MTAAELIEELKQYPLDTDVMMKFRLEIGNSQMIVPLYLNINSTEEEEDVIVITHKPKGSFF